MLKRIGNAEENTPYFSIQHSAFNIQKCLTVIE